MALYLVNARDKAGALDLRMATREAHLAWAGAHADKILMAGPVFLDDGETMAGSTFVLEMDSLAAVRAWAAEDPYAQAGLFETVEIRPFRWAIGEGRRG
ncbi:MAG: YciI family protein [Pseudomonadota bacterium]